jgi:hypothetical protein
MEIQANTTISQAPTGEVHRKQPEIVDTNLTQQQESSEKMLELKVCHNSGTEKWLVRDIVTRIISISSLETLVRGGWVEAEPPETKEAPFAPP